MSYTVLARRYRSNTFDEVVGQEAIAKTLKNAIATDRVAHAYLFSGTRGVGKTTMARILAKALNCLNFDKPTPTPCCQCESCLAISEGEDIDVLEIDGASNTGVEHIRQLRQNAIYRPARARFKVYIIDEVHMLSVSAFNALLKTLEEPPEHVKFILATTEPNKVLPTILSRCQRFDFRNIRPDDIAGQLKKILAGEGLTAEEVLIRRIARLAHGSMRDALSLLDQLLSMSDGKLTLDMLADLLGTPRSQQIIDLVEAIAKGNLADALQQIDQTLAEGLALDQLAQSLQDHFRDLLVLRNCGADTELIDLEDKNIREKLVEQSHQFDEAVLVYNITVMEELRRSIKSSGAGRALLEAAIVRLAASERFSDTQSLLEQLQSGPNAAAAATGGSKTAFPETGGRGRSYSPGPTDRKVSAPAGQQPPQNNPQATAKQALVLPGQLSLEYLRNNWPKILEKFYLPAKQHLAVCLKPSAPIGWQDGNLTIGFKDNQTGMLNFLQDHSEHIEQIETTLTEILGQPIKLNLGNLSEDDCLPTANKKEKPTQPPGAKPSQKEINQAMSDARVKQVQEILGGKVCQISRTNPTATES